MTMLANRRLFVAGASRGIGLAIELAPRATRQHRHRGEIRRAKSEAAGQIHTAAASPRSPMSDLFLD